MNERILVVDDNKTELETMVEILKKSEYRVFSASGGREALYIFEDIDPDVIITDKKMPDVDGMELIKLVTKANSHTQLILITGYASGDDSLKATDAGALYLPKPFGADTLRTVVKRALDKQKLRVQNVSARSDGELGFSNILGNSKAMQEIFRTIRLVAPTRATVLILGESGTGKELIARAIHDNSPRKKKNFIPVNCAAIPKELLESELFGHERGAFTTAVSQRRGRFELAHGGTLFLDEIGEMSVDMQAKLLRVVEEREFTRIGGNESIKVDVRVISATNKNLEQAMEDGKFRVDLFYRLNAFTITIPPLRERREDIPIMVYAFMQEFSKEYDKPVTKITRPAMELLINYDWNGNVRELRNEIGKAIIFCDSDTLDVKNFDDKVRSAEHKEASLDVKVGMTMDEIEKEALAKTLLETSGNKKRAAEMLKIPLRTFHRRLEKYGIKKAKMLKSGQQESK